jgi:hypothetical protein
MPPQDSETRYIPSHKSVRQQTPGPSLLSSLTRDIHAFCIASNIEFSAVVCKQLVEVQRPFRIWDLFYLSLLRPEAAAPCRLWSKLLGCAIWLSEKASRSP